MNLNEAKKFIKEFIEEAKENFEVKQGNEQVTNIFEKDTESKGLKKRIFRNVVFYR